MRPVARAQLLAVSLLAPILPTAVLTGPMLTGLVLPAWAQEDLSGQPPPAGDYHLELGHARLLFRVNHLGMSNYTALFTRFEADLAFDPDAPETMQVTAHVETASVETHYPDPAFDFNAVIAGPEFLDAAQFPEATFRSTEVRQTGPQTARVTGDLTLRGVTHPITFETTFNGGNGGHPLDVGARIGFSAVATLERSAFGMTYGLPPPGTSMGVDDRVELILEAEFVKPRD